MIDALVVGGGFYGAYIACYLSRRRRLRRVRLVEREPELLSRASFNNQARIHNGYHYPRSLVTAYRSRANLPRFSADFPSAVYSDFIKIYAIARRNSKVSARQFVKVCKQIGARLEPAPADYAQLFNPRLVEAVFLAEEYAFNAVELAQWAKEALASCDVEITLGRRVASFRQIAGGIVAEIAPADGRGGGLETVTARNVFNCTYSGLNQFEGAFKPLATGLKHEITEMGLLEMPPALRRLGITVMDGPFFSVMPFPANGLHSLSHVRYTPHLHWYDEAGMDPYTRLDRYDRASRVDRMIRDAKRYLPALADAVRRGSLFEVKTVLARNETDDGRPILLEKSASVRGLYSILGGKIDNIYDIVGILDGEAIEQAPC